MIRCFGPVAVACVLGAMATAADAPKARTWKVGDATREALVAVPASATKQASPLVFVFHGHGGTAKNAASKMAVHEHWADAVVVYPQGLNTPGKLTDPEGKKSGWQHSVGQEADRDLKFFDEMLKSLKADFKIDDARIYATGHSNGGRFTHLLWAERGEVFAAVAPSGSTAGALTKAFKAKPCLHIAGAEDPLVKFAGQKATMDAVQKLNGCAADGKPWQPDAKPTGTQYESKGGTPLVALVYPGGHQFPADGAQRIAAFFKEHAKK